MIMIHNAVRAYPDVMTWWLSEWVQRCESTGSAVGSVHANAPLRARALPSSGDNKPAGVEAHPATGRRAGSTQRRVSQDTSRTAMFCFFFFFCLVLFLLFKFPMQVSRCIERGWRSAGCIITQPDSVFVSGSWWDNGWKRTHGAIFFPPAQKQIWRAEVRSRGVDLTRRSLLIPSPRSSSTL